MVLLSFLPLVDEKGGEKKRKVRVLACRAGFRLSYAFCWNYAYVSFLVLLSLKSTQKKKKKRKNTNHSTESQQSYSKPNNNNTTKKKQTTKQEIP